MNKEGWDKCFGNTARMGLLCWWILHPDGLYNHLNTSVRKFLDYIRDTRDLQHCCTGWSPGLNKKEDGI